MTDQPTPLTQQQIDEYAVLAAAAGHIGGKVDPKAVLALAAEVARLKGQRKYLVAQLAKRDAESGRGDVALREFLAAEPDQDDMAALLPDPAAAVEASEACGKCRQPFDSTDTRFDGHARFYLTPYCRSCVDACHDTEIADHRCVICA